MEIVKRRNLQAIAIVSDSESGRYCRIHKASSHSDPSHTQSSRHPPQTGRGRGGGVGGSLALQMNQRQSSQTKRGGLGYLFARFEGRLHGSHTRSSTLPHILQPPRPGANYTSPDY